MSAPAPTREDILGNLDAILGSIEEASTLGDAIRRGWNGISEVERLAHRLADAGGRLRELIDDAERGGYLDSPATERVAGYNAPTGLGFVLPARLPEHVLEPRPWDAVPVTASGPNVEEDVFIVGSRRRTAELEIMRERVESCTHCRICAGNAVLLRPRERKPEEVGRG